MSLRDFFERNGWHPIDPRGEAFRTERNGAQFTQDHSTIKFIWEPERCFRLTVLNEQLRQGISLLSFSYEHLEASAQSTEKFKDQLLSLAPREMVLYWLELGNEVYLDDSETYPGPIQAEHVCQPDWQEVAIQEFSQAHFPAIENMYWMKGESDFIIWHMAHLDCSRLLHKAKRIGPSQSLYPIATAIETNTLTLILLVPTSWSQPPRESFHPITLHASRPSPRRSSSSE